MFKRLVLEDGSGMLAMAAFFLTFSVFLYFVVRAFFLKKRHIQHMSELPLNQDSEPKQS